MTLAELFAPIIEVVDFFSGMINSIFPPLILDLVFIPVALLAVFAVARYFISVFHK